MSFSGAATGCYGCGGDPGRKGMVGSRNKVEGIQVDGRSSTL